jgi:hypothetical protein
VQCTSNLQSYQHEVERHRCNTLHSVYKLQRQSAGSAVFIVQMLTAQQRSATVSPHS